MVIRGFLVYSCFLECLCFLAFEGNSGLNGNHDFLGLCPCLLNNKYNVSTLNKEPCIFYFALDLASCIAGPTFESCKIPTNPESTGIVYSWGI